MQHAGQLKTLRARQEVLLSAGAMQSPHLLVLSGIGDAEELKQHGIELKHHLPGVGKNFHDHPDFIFGYSVKEFAGTFGISMSGSLDMFKQIGRFAVNAAA